MTEVMAVLVAGVVVAVAAARGHAIGGRAAWAVVVRRLAPCAAGVASACAVAAAGWLWLGLVTPLLCGLMVFLAVSYWGRRSARTRDRESAPRQRWLGALLGAGVGASVAASVSLLVMLAALVAAAASPAEDAPRRTWWSALVGTVHHGFVQHLPVVGPIGDELEAMLQVLDATVEDRARLARHYDWEELADLPEMAAVLADTDVLADLDAARQGDLLALYRLQRNDKVVALFESAQLRRAAEGLRPSHLAAALRSLDQRMSSTPALPSTSVPTTAR